MFILGETILFCQVDGGNFPSSLAHHTCPSCGRYVCGPLYRSINGSWTGCMSYCDTEYDPKPVIEAMTSSKDLKVKSFGECLKLVDEGNYDLSNLRQISGKW